MGGGGATRARGCAMGVAGASSQPTSVQPRPDESNAATARPSRRSVQLLRAAELHRRVRGTPCGLGRPSRYPPGARVLDLPGLEQASIVSSTVRRTVVSNELSAPPPLIARATAAMDTLSRESPSGSEYDRRRADRPDARSAGITPSGGESATARLGQAAVRAQKHLVRYSMSPRLRCGLSGAWARATVAELPGRTATLAVRRRPVSPDDPSVAPKAQPRDCRTRSTAGG